MTNQSLSKTSFLSELDPSNFSIGVKCTDTIADTHATLIINTHVYWLKIKFIFLFRDEDVDMH